MSFSFHSSLEFYFSLSLLSTFYAFCCLIYYIAGILVGFILVGKAVRTLGLNERKGRWVVEQNFHGNFQVNVTPVFTLFSGVLDRVVLILGMV